MVTSAAKEALSYWEEVKKRRQANGQELLLLELLQYETAKKAAGNLKDVEKPEPPAEEPPAQSEPEEEPKPKSRPGRKKTKVQEETEVNQ